MSCGLVQHDASAQDVGAELPSHSEVVRVGVMRTTMKNGVDSDNTLEMPINLKKNFLKEFYQELHLKFIRGEKAWCLFG